MSLNLKHGKFKFTVETTSSDEDFTFIVQNFDEDIFLRVNWGDSSSELIESTGDNIDLSHTYNSPGTYQVSLLGGELGAFNNPTIETQQIKSVDSWGPIKWETPPEVQFDLDSSGVPTFTSLELTYPDEIPVFSESSESVPMIGFGTNEVFNNNNVLDVNKSIPDNLEYWDTSNVTTMDRTFERNQNEDINNLDLSTKLVNRNGAEYIAWDTSSVEEFGSIFANTNFEGNVENWNTSKAESMTFMFSACNSFDGNLKTRTVSVGGESYTAWDVSNVQNMLQMFFQTSFDGDISNWDVSSVVNMRGMFWGTPFNQDISSWNVSSLENMQLIFNSANQFNQDISSWDVSNVTNFRGAFRQTNNFDQNLGLWDVSSAQNMTIMFNGSGISNESAAKTISGWVNPVFNTAGNSVSDLPSDISIGFNNNDYTSFDQFGTGSTSSGTFISGQEAIDRLRDENNWTINIQNG
jgi:surface protein